MSKPNLPQEFFPQKKRRFQLWQGRNLFCCNGKVMFGSDFHIFVATNFLLVAPTVAYFGMVVGQMEDTHKWLGTSQSPPLGGLNQVLLLAWAGWGQVRSGSDPPPVS